jgi:biotin transport system substrate-specific component
MAAASLAFPTNRQLSGAMLWAARVVAVLAGSSLLWVSAKVQVPLFPVPITMQTYVVLTLGALLGWRLGGATILAYLAEGALGLPVFAGTPANGLGLIYMAGPTGGYLAGYVAAVLVVGALAERGWTRTLYGTAATMLIGEVAILGLGSGWLVALFGWDKALAFGVGPFLYGDALKIVLAAGSVYAVGQLGAQRLAHRTPRG